MLQIIAAALLLLSSSAILADADGCIYYEVESTEAVDGKALVHSCPYKEGDMIPVLWELDQYPDGSTDSKDLEMGIAVWNGYSLGFIQYLHTLGGRLDTHWGECGETLLSIAIQDGREDVAYWIIQKAPKTVNLQGLNTCGNPVLPLVAAIRAIVEGKGDIRMVIKLLETGADPNFEVDSGWDTTPTQVANEYREWMPLILETLQAHGGILPPESRPVKE